MTLPEQERVWQLGSIGFKTAKWTVCVAGGSIFDAPLAVRLISKRNILKKYENFFVLARSRSTYILISIFNPDAENCELFLLSINHKPIKGCLYCSTKSYLAECSGCLI